MQFFCFCRAGDSKSNRQHYSLSGKDEPQKPHKPKGSNIGGDKNDSRREGGGIGGGFGDGNKNPGGQEENYTNRFDGKGEDLPGAETKTGGYPLQSNLGTYSNRVTSLELGSGQGENHNTDKNLAMQHRPDDPRFDLLLRQMKEIIPGITIYATIVSYIYCSNLISFSFQPSLTISTQPSPKTG